MIRPRHIRNFDWAFFVTFLLLCVIGLVFVWSARSTLQPGGIDYGTQTLKRQIQWMLVSAIALIAVLFFDYELYRRHAYLIYAVGIAALIMVALVGKVENNARRWIQAGPFRVQPSEFVKIAVVLGVARFLMYRRAHRRLTGLAVPVVLAAVPAAMIALQPDLGTAMVLAPMLFTMLYASGARVKHLLWMAASGVPAALWLWFFRMEDYQKARITSFINPQSDAMRTGFHIIQSIIAIGSGGWTGKGFAGGSQHLLRLVPAAHTDFIFAVIAEEWGFFGGLMVILLFFILFTKAVDIAAKTREPFGRLVIVGCATILAVQVAVNIGMTMRLCPITGLTLPFVSYGGSSLLSSTIMAGLILNVGMRRKRVVAPDDFSS